MEVPRALAADRTAVRFSAKDHSGCSLIGADPRVLPGGGNRSGLATYTALVEGYARAVQPKGKLLVAGLDLQAVENGRIEPIATCHSAAASEVRSGLRHLPVGIAWDEDLHRNAQVLARVDATDVSHRAGAVGTRDLNAGEVLAVIADPAAFAPGTRSSISSGTVYTRIAAGWWLGRRVPAQSPRPLNRNPGLRLRIHAEKRLGNSETERAFPLWLVSVL